MNTKRKYIIEKLMKPGFIEYEGGKIVLEEFDKNGKSILTCYFPSEQNLCVKNLDSKKTVLQFFVDDKTAAMNKRVDHIVFEQKSDDKWDIHLIEMKTTVGDKKWKEIKGKFRASYLLAIGIAAMLDIDVQNIYMYTTYEKVSFYSDTMPTSRRLPVGRELVNYQDEWDGKKFTLDFGEKVPFRHRAILMYRKEDKLEGEFS